MVEVTVVSGRTMLRRAAAQLGPLKTHVAESYTHPLKVAAAKPVYQREHCPGGSFDGLGELMAQTDQAYLEENPLVIPHWYEPVGIVNHPTLRVADDGSTVYEDRPRSYDMQRRQIDLYFEEGAVGRALAEPAKPPVVIDAGANIGLFAREVIARRSAAAPGAAPAEVWCIEPIPATQVALRLNLEAYLPPQRPKVLPFALGRSHGFETYHVKRGSSPTATSRPEDCVSQAAAIAALADAGVAAEGLAASFRSQRADPVECEVRPLSAVIAAHGMPYISLLKVDVEGAELDALLGIDDAHWPLIDAVVVEVHNQDGTRLAAVERLLAQHGLNHQKARQPAAHTELMLLWAARTPW